MALFDSACKNFLQIKKDGNFEKVFLDTPRKGDEQCIAGCSRKAAEFRRDGNDVGLDLVDSRRHEGQTILVRQADLNAMDHQNVATWLEGKRDERELRNGAATAQLEWTMHHDELPNSQYQQDRSGKRVKQWCMGLAEKNIHMDSVLAAKDNLPEAMGGHRCEVSITAWSARCAGRKHEGHWRCPRLSSPWQHAVVFRAPPPAQHAVVRRPGEADEQGEPNPLLMAMRSGRYNMRNVGDEESHMVQT